MNTISISNPDPTTNKCKKTQQFKTVFNGDTAYITQLKQQKIKKVLLLLQHVAIMSTCS